MRIGGWVPYRDQVNGRLEAHPLSSFLAFNARVPDGDVALIPSSAPPPPNSAYADAEKEGRERQPRGRRRAGGAQLRDRDGARYEHGVVQHAGVTARGSASGMRGRARQADSARDTKHVATEADVREDEERPRVSSLSQA
jgi:hypothetical protein